MGRALLDERVRHQPVMHDGKASAVVARASRRVPRPETSLSLLGANSSRVSDRRPDSSRRATLRGSCMSSDLRSDSTRAPVRPRYLLSLAPELLLEKRHDQTGDTFRVLPEDPVSMPLEHLDRGT